MLEHILENLIAKSYSIKLALVNKKLKIDL